MPKEEHGRAGARNGDCATAAFNCACLPYVDRETGRRPSAAPIGTDVTAGDDTFEGRRAVKTRLAIFLALAATSSALAPMPASAAHPGRRRRLRRPLRRRCRLRRPPSRALPPHEITTSMRSMGLKPISPPVRRGDRYIVRAIDRRGIEVRVAADALSGRVLAVRPIEGPLYADRAYPRIYRTDRWLRRAEATSGRDATSRRTTTSSRGITCGRRRAFRESRR